MRRPLFDFVEQIRDAEKYFDVSRDEIRRLLLSKGKCRLPFDVDIVGHAAEPLTAEVELNINTFAESPLGWTMALKLHDIRIDGFDYETKYPMRDHQIGRGWHRHCWDKSEESSERHKVPVDAFDHLESRDEFLVRGFGLLKIRLNKIDHGQDVLFT